MTEAKLNEAQGLYRRICSLDKYLAELQDDDENTDTASLYDLHIPGRKELMDRYSEELRRLVVGELEKAQAQFEAL